MLVIHIRSLDEKTLARLTYDEQKDKQLPGLVRETRIICQELNIEDCNETQLNKSNFRSLLIKACHSKNEERIIIGASEVKCARLKTEEYGRKSYIQEQTISQCRKWFRTRFGLQEFAGNYSHNKKFSKTNWMCRCLKEVEKEGHIVSGQCEVYGDLRSQFGDLQEDKNLVQYFQAVLDRRDSLEEEDRRQRSSTAAVGASPVSGDRERTSHPGSNTP
jgi:hypothetical protein